MNGRVFLESGSKKGSRWMQSLGALLNRLSHQSCTTRPAFVVSLSSYLERRSGLAYLLLWADRVFWMSVGVHTVSQSVCLLLVWLWVYIRLVLEQTEVSPSKKFSNVHYLRGIRNRKVKHPSQEVCLCRGGWCVYYAENGNNNDNHSNNKNRNEDVTWEGKV